MRPAFAFLCLVLPFAAGAQIPVPALPQFEDYPAPAAFEGRIADVDLDSSPRARTYRTRLREGAAGGANFAGHFAVVDWGCGSGCQDGAIVDVRTGRVYDLQEGTSFGTRYRLDSRLLVLNPPEIVLAVVGPDGEIPGWAESKYYVWEDGDLRHLRTLTSSQIAALGHGAAPAGVPPTTEGAVRELVPLAVGNEWNYRGEDHNGEYTARARVTNVVRRGGVDWFRVEWAHRGYEPGTGFQFWRNGTDGFYKDEGGGGTTFFPYANGRATAGRSWTRVDEETVVVGRRSYDAVCYVSAEDEDFVTSTCFVPGVGMASNDGGYTEELTSYDVDD